MTRTAEPRGNGSGSQPVQLRMVAWNCNMALHRKWDALMQLAPDIAVISECARPEIVERRYRSSLGYRDALWIGSNEQKGLAVFTYGPWGASKQPDFQPDIDFVLPAHVTGPAAFSLLGVWAFNHKAKRTPAGTRSGRQVQLGMERYFDRDGNPDVVVAGDFNDNVIWNGRRPGPITMGNCIEALESRELVSAYHHSRGEVFGSELLPTLFRKAEGGVVNTYHIDYSWLPARWIIDSVDVGSQALWYDGGLSDHAPIAVTATIPRSSSA